MGVAGITGVVNKLSLTTRFGVALGWDVRRQILVFDSSFKKVTALIFPSRNGCDCISANKKYDR
jgi:hypothetical protein